MRKTLIWNLSVSLALAGAIAASAQELKPKVADSASDTSSESDFVTPHKLGAMMCFVVAGFPTGDFGDNSGDQAGLATFGAGGGLEYSIPIPTTPLSWVIGGRLIVNPYDTKAAKNDVQTFMDGAFNVTMGPNTTVSGGTWFTAPLLTGLKIGGKPAPWLEPFAVVQGGVTLVNEGDIKFSDGANSAVLASDPSFRAGLEFGAGATIQDRFHLGVRYFKTEKAKMTGKVTSRDGQSADVNGSISVSMLELMIGVVF